jgi:hypothetical protein
MADQNKTELTLRITESACLWLKEIGCKPVETEVWVADRWIADVAAGWIPTQTEAHKSKLLPSKPGWNRREARDAWEVLYDALPRLITVVLEVKSSVGDFRGDRKWTVPSPSDMRVLSMPLGMVAESEWPAGWWILVHSPETGKLLKVARRAPLTPTDDSSRAWIIHQIGCRIHNRTEYQRFQDLQRSHRSGQNDYTNRLRLSNAVRAVVAVVNGEGGNVEECMERHFNYEFKKLPENIVILIKGMYGVARANPIAGANKIGW